MVQTWGKSGGLGRRARAERSNAWRRRRLERTKSAHQVRGRTSAFFQVQPRSAQFERAGPLKAATPMRAAEAASQCPALARERDRARGFVHGFAAVAALAAVIAVVFGADFFAGLQRFAVPFFPAGDARVVSSPPPVAVRELESSSVRPGRELPVVADLSILKAAEGVGAPDPWLGGLEVSQQLPLKQADGRAAADRPPPPHGFTDNAGPENLSLGPVRLPPLELAPLDGGITASEGAFDGLAQRQRLCEVEPSKSSLPELALPAGSPEFGRALAAAALRQTSDFVVYTDKYRRMSFPMGDVPALFGVCTDVVIRAYRAVGIDLQANIHAAHIGPADTSIAHRRTFTMRRYFASRGASVPITDFPEDYLPGDIVTYDRPQNHGSRDHIAIVSDMVAPSGRPMIVHNRGWGPQLEDALFVDRITGHYRYSGATRAVRAQRVTANKGRPGESANAKASKLPAKSSVRAAARTAILKTRKLRGHGPRQP